MNAGGSVPRFERLDVWRGLAMLWMAGFHFSFDLNLYGYLHPRQVFTLDPFWTAQRSLIVSMFLLAAGAGQAIALQAGQSWVRFWRRWVQVVGCAALVSLGSRWMFPDSWIHFGVLHGIAAMLLIVRLLGLWTGGAIQSRQPLAWLAWLLSLSLLLWCLPHVWTDPFFDTRWTDWTGLVTRLPVTEDYVPVLPWLGMMLAGFALAGLVSRHRPHWLGGPLPAPLRPLAALGRWPLTFYMLHQPLLLGALLSYRTIAP